MLKGGVFLKYPDAFYDGLKHGMLERTLKAVSYTMAWFGVYLHAIILAP